jgi:hypothetical protein
VDPLSSNAALILARSFRETNDNAGALRALEANEAYPVFIEDIQMVPTANQTRLQGSVTGNQAAAGTPIRLRFTFYNGEGATIVTQTVSVAAPAPQASATFDVTYSEAAAAYSYQVEP